MAKALVEDVSVEHYTEHDEVAVSKPGVWRGFECVATVTVTPSSHTPAELTPHVMSGLPPRIIQTVGNLHQSKS